MADDSNDQVQTPEQVEAEKARLASERRAQEQAELAQAISTGVVEGLARRAAAERKAETPPPNQDPPIQDIDPAEIDRRLKAGEPIADLIARFGANLVERTRREVLAQTGGAVSGLQEVVLNTARKEIEHFTEFESEIEEVVKRVSPERRTLKVYQEATAMVLGRPENHKKLVDAEVALVMNRQKPSAGAAETGGATRMIKGTGAEARGDGDLAATEDNLEKLVGADAYAAFIDLKRSRGVTLDGFAQRLGYEDAKVWFKRMQDNDRRSATEGLGLDR